jgi:hypothetical protein
MTPDDAKLEQPDSGSPSGLHELEVRIARLEAQTFAHAERLGEFDAAARVRQKRALWLRLVLLLLALVAFFAIKWWGTGGAP